MKNTIIYITASLEGHSTCTKRWGETLRAGDRQGSGAVVYLPLLGIGRGGKDGNTRAGASGSAPGSPQVKGDSQEAKYKNNNTKKKISRDPTTLHLFLLPGCYSDCLMPKMGCLPIVCLLGSGNADTVIHFIWAAGHFHLASVLETLPAAMFGLKALLSKTPLFRKKK